jgi:hypothetical protein
MKKDFNSGYGRNLKMNDDVYALRRQVIDIIYQAKNVLRSNGIDLPRLDVRIIENSADKPQVLGVARLKGNIIWIATKSLEKYKAHLRDTVYHEIVHAVTGFGHDDNCKLMAPCINLLPLSDDEANGLLVKYFKNHS